MVIPRNYRLRLNREPQAPRTLMWEKSKPGGNSFSPTTDTLGFHPLAFRHSGEQLLGCNIRGFRQRFFPRDPYAGTGDDRAKSPGPLVATAT